MDFRELELARIFVAETKTYGRSMLDALNILVEKDKELFPGNEFFLDQKVFSSKDPLTNASEFGFRLVMGSREQEDHEYNKYKDFFDDLLSAAKKDIISGELLRIEGDMWVPVENKLQAIKSYAKGKNLKPSDVEMHFKRYVDNKKKELLVDVPEWDGIDRVHELEKYIKLKGHEFAIFEDALKEWMANIFRRLYLNGAQNRCIILKGDQGIGKDKLIKNLFGEFGPYYAKFSNASQEKDVWSQVHEALVIHIEEFDQTGRLNVAFLKDLITRDFVKYRGVHERKNQVVKCHASFISTVNIDAVLRDETGNRRFAVFEVESIDWNYPKDWSLQMIAHAYALYVDGYKAKKETWDAVSKFNAQFEQVDLVPELLDMWDTRVSRLDPDIEKTKEFKFETIQGVVSDMSKASGWKQKTILTMLKTHNRSRHTKTGARYKSGCDSVENTQNDQNRVIERIVKNHATGDDVSIKVLSHHIDHHLKI